MKINALLDVNVVAHETQDEVTVLLELQAPAAVADAARPQASLEVVLDRSGSMSGAPLEGAKRALIALVRRLEPTDNFGLVTFDTSADVVVPAGPLTDKERVIAQIQAVHTGGMTDLSTGYVRGLRELRRISKAGGTLLVISDGHINAGITGIDEFAAVASKASSKGITTSTLGYGQGYDESLLSALARAGNGNHVFADNPDAAGAAIAGEVEGLLNKVVQAMTLTVSFEPAVEFLRLFNDLPTQQLPDGTVMVELGDLYGEEARKILLKFKVPAMAGLGLAKVATLELAYVELPGLIEHVAALPIHVNVVPGDEAAGRIPHPTVHSELLFQEAQESKRKASDAFERGDTSMGKMHLGESISGLRHAAKTADGELADAIDVEIEAWGALAAEADDLGPSYMSKTTRASYHAHNRKRGRAHGEKPSDLDPDER